MLACLFISLGLTGCGQNIMGKVIKGDSNTVELVHQSDPRLRTTGINNVEVTLRRDPHSANKQLAGRKRTEPTGDYSMRIDDFDASWAKEEWLLQTYATGYRSTNQLIKLPPNDRRWRLLITIAPGTAEAVDDMDQIMKEVEQFQ